MGLTAPPEIQAMLLDLQAIDTRLGQLAHREAHLPERAAAEAAAGERDAVKADLATTAGALEDARLELGRVEADVATVERRIAADGDRMLQANSARDVAGFGHEIESLQRRRSELEDIELAVMERVEEHELAVADLESRLAALGVAADEAGAAVARALAAIEADRAAAGSQRATLVAGLPEDLVALYERQRARYGVGASLLRRGISEASGVALPSEELAGVRAAAPEAVLLCESSGAILVRTAESGL